MGWLYIQLSLGNRIPTFFGKSCHLAWRLIILWLLYCIFLFFLFGGEAGGGGGGGGGGGDLMWIWLYQFLSSLIYFTRFSTFQTRKFVNATYIHLLLCHYTVANNTRRYFLLSGYSNFASWLIKLIWERGRRKKFQSHICIKPLHFNSRGRHVRLTQISLHIHTF